MMQKVTEVQKLIVGKYYLVPCLEVEYKIHGFAPGDFVPIIGDIHEDKDLNLPHLHYHYDFRVVGGHINPQVVISVFLDGEVIWPIVNTPVVWKKKRCISEVNDVVYRSAGKEFFYKLSTQKSKKMTCLTCPHKGFPLNAIPPKEDGGIVCPGHGLKWHKDSGELML